MKMMMIKCALLLMYDKRQQYKRINLWLYYKLDFYAFCDSSEVSVLHNYFLWVESSLKLNV